jgi:hypothetical protein
LRPKYFYDQPSWGLVGSLGSTFHYLGSTVSVY